MPVLAHFNHRKYKSLWLGLICILIFILAKFLWNTESNEIELNALKNYAIDHPFTADRTNLLPQEKLTSESIPSRLTKYDIWA